MLVLSRRESERIRLGDSIVVTVVKVAGDRVRLGIEAPMDILVLRGELERRPVEPDSTRRGLAAGIILHSACDGHAPSGDQRANLTAGAVAKAGENPV